MKNTYQQISQLLKAKKYSDAEVLIDQQLKEHPKDPSLHNFKGAVHFARKQWKQAIASFEVALANRPNDPRFLRNKTIAEKRSASWGWPLTWGAGSSLFLSYAFVEGIKISWYWMFPISVAPTVLLTLSFKYCADRFQPVERPLPPVAPTGYTAVSVDEKPTPSSSPQFSATTSSGSSATEGDESDIDLMMNAVEFDADSTAQRFDHWFV